MIRRADVFIAFFTMIGGALTVLSQTAPVTAAPPLVVDFAAAACVIGSAIAALRRLHAASRKASPGFVVQSEQIRRKRKLITTLTSVSITVAVVILCWNLRDPWVQAATLLNPWELCVSVRSKCGKGQCVQLLDRKGRVIVDRCVPILDDSGLLKLHQENIFQYRPVTVRTRCGLPDEEKQLPATSFAPYCEAELTVP